MTVSQTLLAKALSLAGTPEARRWFASLHPGEVQLLRGALISVELEMIEALQAGDARKYDSALAKFRAALSCWDVVPERLQRMLESAEQEKRLFSERLATKQFLQRRMARA